MGAGPAARCPSSRARHSVWCACWCRRRAPLLRIRDAFRTDQTPALPTSAPHMRWNDPLGPTRAIAFASLPLDEVKAVGRAVGATVNDVVLAVLGGASRSYLEARGELPDRALVAAVPVSVRRPNEDVNEVANAVTLMFASLGTDIADPLARVEAVHSSAHGAKHLQDAIGPDTFLQWLETPSPLVIAAAARLYVGLHLSSRAAGNREPVGLERARAAGDALLRRRAPARALPARAGLRRGRSQHHRCEQRRHDRLRFRHLPRRHLRHRCARRRRSPTSSRNCADAVEAAREPVELPRRAVRRRPGDRSGSARTAVSRPSRSSPMPASTSAWEMWRWTERAVRNPMCPPAYQHTSGLPQCATSRRTWAGSNEPVGAARPDRAGRRARRRGRQPQREVMPSSCCAIVQKSSKRGWWRKRDGAWVRIRSAMSTTGTPAITPARLGSSAATAAATYAPNEMPNSTAGSSHVAM